MRTQERRRWHGRIVSGLGLGQGERLLGLRNARSRIIRRRLWRRGRRWVRHEQRLMLDALHVAHTWF